METSDVPFGSQRSVQGGTLVKKPVLFVIAIVFVLSVVVINFFGLSLRNDQFKNYVNKIEFVSDDIREIKGDDGKTYKLLIVEYDGGADGTQFIDLDYKIYPSDNSVNPGVKWTVRSETDDNEDLSDKITVTELGMIEIYENAKGGSYIVTIKAIDGSNCSDTIRIIVRK